MGTDIFTDTLANSESTRIYCIRVEGTNIVKVGISSNPKNRLYSLQIGNHQKLEILTLSLYHMNRSTAEFIEASLHKNICKPENKIRGEWYQLGDDEIVELIKCIKHT